MVNKCYDERESKNRKKAFKESDKVVAQVAKDTNKTRRKDTLLPLKNAVKKKTRP
jgi:hypothetical protein